MLFGNSKLCSASGLELNGKKLTRSPGTSKLFPHFIIYFNYYQFWCVVHVKMAEGKRPRLDEKPEEQGEDKSAKAIRMLREVTMLLGETTNNHSVTFGDP